MADKSANPHRAALSSGRKRKGLLGGAMRGIWLALALWFPGGCAATTKNVIYAEDQFSAGRYRCVVVAPFENQSHTEGAGFAVADFMASAFQQSQRFRVVDRKEVQLLLENPSNADYKMDPGLAVELGKRLRAEAVMVGAVSDYWYRTSDGKPEIALTMRMVDVETGRVVYVANANYRPQFFSKRPFLLTAAAKEIAETTISPLTAGIPPRRLDDLQCGIREENTVAAVPPPPAPPLDVVGPADTGAGEIVAPEPATSPVVAALPPEPVLTPGVLVLLRRMNMSKNFVLEGVDFELDKTSFKGDSYRDAIRNLGLALTARPALSLRLEVHTDGLGDAEFNRKLTDLRAQLLKQMLVNEYNIAPERVEAIGLGGERPLLPNINRKNRETNRRVEITVLQGP